MAHDVFVSYSTKDKPVADAVVAGLESKGIRCWVAPRDVVPGSSWGDSIVSAIQGSRFMVIILSGNSNQSKQVVREVERAVAKNVIIIPFRIEDIDPTGAMAYFLSTEHWLDAITPPLESHIAKLQTTLQHFLSGDHEIGIQGTLSPARGQASAPARRMESKTGWLVLATVVILAVAGVLVLPKLLSNPSQGTPTEVSLPITSSTSSVPTLTPSPPPLPAFRLLGSYPTSREAPNVFVLNGIAYIANGEDGVRILDVSDPSQPLEIGHYPLENTQNIIVVDDIAYVVEQGLLKDNMALKDKLVILDVQSPANPQYLGEYQPDSYTHQSLSNMAVFDQVVYLTFSDKMIAVDASEPAQPVMVGEYSFFSNISSPGVVVVDGIAFLQANELHVVNFRDPAAPVEIGGYDSSWGSSIVIQDQTAYIATWSSGMVILDISNPARPLKLGQYLELVGSYDLLPPGAESRQTLLDVAVSGDIAYLTYSFGEDHSTWTQVLESGVIAVDVSDPANPQKIAVYSDLDQAADVTAVGDLVFVTDSARGLFILSKPE
jgi:hypothetical protein